MGVAGLTAEGFDDGRADVPAGAAGPVERVVVVGAGIAGLTVANALTHGGVECVVVEARDRIGGRLLAGLGPDASEADGIEAFVAGAGLAPGPARRARQALRALVEGESADLAERQSLRWMWNEMEYEGHYFGDVPEGGYGRLVEAMAAGVDLRLGVDVAEIACSPGGVRVRGADGSFEDGSHVEVEGRAELSLHLKLPGEMSLEDAHEVAEQVERAI